MKLEQEDGYLTARTNHLVLHNVIDGNGCLSEKESPIGEAYACLLDEDPPDITMTVNHDVFEMTAEDAIKVGQALITLGTIARNKTIIKEPTNDQ